MTQRGASSVVLSDEKVADKIREMWPDVNAWVAQAPDGWTAEPNSELADDDTATGGDTTHTVRTSLVIGSEALMMACAWLNNHGPTMFATRALLRTALVGGAQAVWMLCPDEASTRITRTRMVRRESVARHQEWLKDVETVQVGADELDNITAVRASLSGIEDRLGPGARARMTTMVKEATAFVYGDANIVQSVLVEWRSASGLAHALSWDLHTRAQNTTTTKLPDGRLLVSTRSRLGDHQAALSASYALLQTGWNLLEQRGTALH